MPRIRPITDLRNTTEISEMCHENHEPVFITKNGYGDLVVMSIEAYEEILKTIQDDLAISDAERELTEGQELLNARDAFSALRRKHFG
ncbi:MAG: type II toxin-antitoxin system Phd/YefM family antitoxin [Clostridiales bacterium]|nr:type II toxin-antitoxin system Phd/YefM family antitoxin [Clostridiales bacterium]MDY6117082.1 type II toxin-antitoxin system Phd/YefM family antitoxin [Anaerovoracaceae bacterium]